MVKLWYVSYNYIFINIVIFFKNCICIDIEIYCLRIVMLDRILSMMVVIDEIEFL